MGRDIVMLSLSIDPVADTPERRKAYWQAFGAKPGWLFLTGKPADIDRLRHELGHTTPARGRLIRRLPGPPSKGRLQRHHRHLQTQLLPVLQRLLEGLARHRGARCECRCPGHETGLILSDCFLAANSVQ